jgi:hypothetical protein
VSLRPQQTWPGATPPKHCRVCGSILFWDNVEGADGFRYSAITGREHGPIMVQRAYCTMDIVNDRLHDNWLVPWASRG